MHDLNVHNKIAFFDIDGTLFRSSLLIALVDKLIQEEIFPPETKDLYRESHMKWLNREGTYDRYIEDVIQAFVYAIKGVHYGSFADVGKRVVSVEKKKVYRYTRDLIRTLKQENYYLVAISQSPKTILDEFCREYGFNKVYGRIYEIGPQDRFTGAVTDEHLIENKASIVQRVLQNYSASATHTLAVGDTESDIPLLDLVTEAICFNPNQTLYDHAMRRGWSVVVERKDVIYTM